MTDSSLATYLVPIRRWWWMIAGLVAVAVGLAALTLTGDARPSEDDGAQAGAYSATHLLIRNGEAGSQLSFELIALLGQQGELSNRVAQRMPAVDIRDVQRVVLVSDPITETLSITATRPTADGAEELASTYAAELVSFLDERTLSNVENDFQRVTERIADLQASIDEIQSEIASAPEGDPELPLLTAELDSLLEEFSLLRTQERSLDLQRQGLAESFVTLEGPTPVPAEGEGDALALPRRPVLRLGLAALLAALVGTAGVLLLDRFDTRIRTRREAEEAFGLPVLAELPKRSRRHIQAHALPTYHDPGGVTAEVLRALRLSIALAPTWHLTSLVRDSSGAVGGKTPVKLGHEPRSIVITSALTGDGKSTLAANLAISIAEGGKRVLVVDCDFRRPAVGKLLEVEPGVGLRELTRIGERPIRDLAAPTLAPNVAMVRSGSRGVTPAWFMREAAELVERCLGMADVVIFDTGPITLTNEASALLPYADTGLVVARAGKVATDQARGAIEQLTQVDAHVSGVILVGSESRRRYGYGYYTSSKDEEEVAVTDDSVEPRAATSPWDTNRPPSNGAPAAPEAADREASTRHSPM